MSQPQYTEKPQKRSPKTAWLVATLSLMILTIIVWILGVATTQNKDKKMSGDEREIKKSEVISEIVLTQNIESLHELDNVIKPINFDAVIRDVRDYSDEFKDMKYLAANKNKWTLEVMDVYEEKLIKDYLVSRADRKEFAYFRIKDKGELKYILTYDSFTSLDAAKSAIKKLKFNLPKNMKVLPTEVNNYINVIDKYERSADISDLSVNRPRSVILMPTNRQITAKNTPQMRLDKLKAEQKLLNSESLLEKNDENVELTSSTENPENTVTRKPAIADNKGKAEDTVALQNPLPKTKAVDKKPNSDPGLKPFKPSNKAEPEPFVSQ